MVNTYERSSKLSGSPLTEARTSLVASLIVA